VLDNITDVLSEMNISGTLVVVDGPIYPQKVNILSIPVLAVIFVLAGLLIGFIGIILNELLYPGFRTESDVTESLGLRNFGVIPELHKNIKGKRLQREQKVADKAFLELFLNIRSLGKVFIINSSDNKEDKNYIAVMLAAASPSLYLAFVTYNQAIIPPTLALSIAAGREGVPLPTVIELILMSLAMSVIREAGLRMTGSVGYFIGTLAAVLIGQSIVTAGYVSSSLIIVVAAATISSFAISTTTMVYPVKILDFFFIVLAGLFGIFGIVNGLIILFWHLVSLNSFGVPYLYPVIPFDKDGFKDTFVRSSYRKLKKRTKRLAPQNRVREGDNGAE
jgi:hypothetical protein